MPEVDYLISTKVNKFLGYQSKKGNRGYVKSYISNIWDITQEWTGTLKGEDHVSWFVRFLVLMIIHERYCLERAFQRIKIKGGMCKPCCVEKLSDITFEYLYGIKFEENKKSAVLKPN